MYSSLCTYDIRSQDCGLAESDMTAYLHQAVVRDALGVNLNYSRPNEAVFLAFQSTCDWVRSATLESLLDKGVRVALY